VTETPYEPNSSEFAVIANRVPKHGIDINIVGYGCYIF